LCTSGKAAGDTISFSEIFTQCSAILTSLGRPLVEDERSRHNAAALTIGLKRILKELCDLTVFIQGFKLKCPRCSTISWYHIQEVSSRVKCNGCLEDFHLPIEPAFYYKLNGLIAKNFYSSSTQPDGNLTVIKTLTRLCDAGRATSFEFSPQLNLFDDYDAEKPAAEIDILVLVNGHFIIGEAKHNSSAFSQDKHKSLNSLIDVAKAIRPDKVILTCMVDHHDKLQRAKEYLAHHFAKLEYPPQIETICFEEPTYFRLHGVLYFY
jgi:hypothetical protein